MKKIILILAHVMMTNLSAQLHPKLTANQNAYFAGDSLVMQQVEFKDPGSVGRGLHWDFSVIRPINEEYTLKYFYPNPDDTTRICGMEHNTRYYYRQRNDSLQATGYENSTTQMEYLTPELKMHYPFAFGDTLTSPFRGNGQYCHRLQLILKGYTRIEADAEGELKLPENEILPNALRIHTLRHYAQTGKDSIEMVLDTYSWYSPKGRYPVFESIETNIIKKGTAEYKVPIDTTVFSTSFYYPPIVQQKQLQSIVLPLDNTPSTEQNIASVFTEAQLMPNPVESYLYINYKLTRTANIWFTLHNNNGIPLCVTAAQTLDAGIQSTSIRMSNLITGVYSLYVHVDDMAMRLNVIKK